jgi:hypothetical protein
MQIKHLVIVLVVLIGSSAGHTRINQLNDLTQVSVFGEPPVDEGASPPLHIRDNSNPL